MAVTVSEKPWSDWTKADYTPEQWHAACLIHQHQGPPTSKDQCKLPVRTPTGTLNRNGVFAAAAALAGARGGVNASPEEKAKAASALLRYYKQLDAEPPPSLRHDASSGLIARFATELFHFGVKGMKWGVRTDDSGSGGSRPTATSVSAAKKTVIATALARANAKATGLSSSPRYRGKDLNSDPKLRAEYDADARAMFKQQLITSAKRGVIIAGTVVAFTIGGPALGLATGALGTRTTLTTKERNLDTGELFTLDSETIEAADTTSYILKVQRDDKGFITKFIVSEEGMTQSDLVDDFISHFGVKGMKWGVRREPGPSGTVTGGKEGGTSSKTRLSADAERFLKTRAKQEHEMSDREIKEANSRAQAIKQYNQTFNDLNGPLRQKVETLQLQKSYKQLNAEMNPSKMQRAASLAKTLAKGYSAFQRLDKESGGLLSKSLKSAFAKKSSPASTVAKTVSKGPFRVNPAKVKITPTSGIPTRGKGYRINPDGSLSVVP